MSNSLQRLVEITMQSIVEGSGQSSRLARGRGHLFDIEDSWPAGLDEDVTQIALATAQRVDMPAKIAASTK